MRTKGTFSSIRLFLALAAASTLAFGALPAVAQEPTVEVDSSLPFATKRVIDIALDAPDAEIAAGSTTVERGRVHRGSLVQLGGRLEIEGTVTGDVTAIDSRVYLRPGARIGGHLTVLGGGFYGTTMATVEGREVWLRQEPVRVVRPGPDRLRIERVAPETAFPLEPKGLMGVVVHEYNGVDGLLFGVAAGLKKLPRQPRTELVFGPVFRTARDDVGWDLAALRELPRRGVTVGGRVHRITETHQRWQRSDLGNSFASLVYSDDDRTYFERTGYEAWVERAVDPTITVRARWRDDDFESLAGREPFAFFDDENWPRNPEIDEGRGRALGVEVTLDRRNAPDFPTGGFHLRGSYDHWGFGGDLEHEAGEVEARGYLPLFGESFLGLRVMAGGRLDDGPLPTQFRWRLGSGGVITGYDAFDPRLVGDRMAVANARLHLAIPSPVRVFETLYLVGLADVGDAWVDGDDPEAVSGFGGGLAVRGQFRYIGVFGSYGVDSEQWKAYFLVAPWF